MSGKPASARTDADSARRKAPREPVGKRLGRMVRTQELVLGVLHELLRAEGTGVDPAISDALAQIGSFLGCDRTYVMQVRNGDRVDNTHEWCAEGIEPMQAMLQDVPLDMISYWLPPFMRRDPVRITSVNRLPASREERAILQQQGIQSLLVVPMLDGNELRGFVGFDTVRSRRIFLQSEVYLLQSAADVIMSVLQRRASEAAAREAQAALRAGQAFLQSILDTTGSGIVALDGQGRIIFANEEADQILARLERPESQSTGAAEFLSHFFQRVQAEDTEVRDVNHVVETRDGERCVLSVNAAPVRDGTGQAARVVCSFIDLTREDSIRNALQSALTDAHQLAYVDPLTGLPNRRALVEDLEAMITDERPGEQWFTLLSIDVDGMRGINELHGMRRGDYFLLELAKRLQGLAPEGARFGRTAGDEFVVILPAAHPDEAAAISAGNQLGDLVRDAAREPVRVGVGSISATTSVAVVPFSRSRDADSVLNKAGIANRVAKAEGGDRTKVFAPALRRLLVARAQLDADLQGALERDEFCLFFEPQVEASPAGLSTIGYEALIRWQHPVRGLLPPSEFIPHAEETGLVAAIDDWVLRSACTQIRTWDAQGLGQGLTLSLNISSARFVAPGFPAAVEATLDASGVDPARLRFELTESCLLQDAAAAAHIMGRLKELGISLALDDFGSGFSSLRYLHDLPVDVLKIDRAFIGNLWESGRNPAIIRSILSLGESLRLKVITEGVETEPQLEWLIANGGTLFQGYYFGRPRPPRDLDLTRPG